MTTPIPMMRRALLLALVTGAVACADKVLTPSAFGSPRFTLQITALGRASAVPQQLVVAAVYFSSVRTQNSDTIRVLDLQSVPATSGSQVVNLKVDLTGCLADATRRGSKDACTMYVGAFLEPQGFNVDSGNVVGQAYDFQLAGPFDAAAGRAPTVPTIDLSTSRFAVNHWEGDEALRIGGDQAPVGLNGPITGVAGTASDSPTLFAVSYGSVNTSTNPNAPTFQPVGQLDIYQNGSWRRVNGPPTASAFTDVAAFAANDVYLAAPDGLYHYDGTAITAVSSVRAPLVSVAVTPPSAATKLVIAGTSTGFVWIGSGSTFTRYSSGATVVLDGVCINGPTEAFASARNTGGLFRFDGTAWTQLSSPITGGKVDLQCLGPGQAYVATFGNGTLLSWSPSGWTPLPAVSASGRSYDFAVTSSSEIYAVGDSGSANRAFYRYDGKTWREVGRSAVTGLFPYRPWADPRGGAAYVGTSPNSAIRIEKVTSSGMNLVTFSPALRGVSMPSSTTAFVVGANYFLARWNGARWTVDAPPSGTATTPTLQSVWSDGPTNAWAVGQQSTILRWDGTRWTVAADSKHLPSFTVDNYNAVWGTGGTVWIAGDASILRCKPVSSPAGGASCSQDAVTGTGALYAIWGTSATNAFAVGANGRIVHFDGTAWTPMSSGTSGRLGAVGGSGPNDVWAIGDTAAVHFDGTKWSSATQTVLGTFNFGYVQNPNSFLTGLWAPRVDEIYLGTQYGAIRRGSSLFWDDMAGPFQGYVGRVVGVSGVTGGCGLAITDGQTAVGGPMLLRGVGPTGCFASPMTGPASWP